jgi:DNA-binding response OmpR family regulator
VQHNQASERPLEDSGGKPRIVVVEDEAMIAMMIEDMLEDMGCVVAGSFGDVRSAMAWLSSGDKEFDGALLDVNLGGETVFPIADLLFEKGKPFGFVTSYSAVPQARTYEAQVLNKPVDSRDLRALVQSFAH